MINKFAENFTDLLRISGYTQKAFAEKMKVRTSTVNQWAKGKREPEIDNILIICYLLNTTPNELIGYKNEEERKEDMIKEALDILRKGLI